MSDFVMRKQKVHEEKAALRRETTQFFVTSCFGVTKDIL